MSGPVCRRGRQGPPLQSLTLSAIVWTLIGWGEADALPARLRVDSRCCTPQLETDDARWRVSLGQTLQFADLTSRPRRTSIARRHSHDGLRPRKVTLAHRDVDGLDRAQSRSLGALSGQRLGSVIQDQTPQGWSGRLNVSSVKDPVIALTFLRAPMA